jgi:hypothetical protein
MSLSTNNNVPYIADKDLIVCKVLDRELKSPCLKFQYELDKLYSMDNIGIKHKEHFALVNYFGHCWNAEKFLYEVNEAFHAYCSKEAVFISINPFYKGFIFKTIIPKGAKYIVGINGEICSNQIIITSKTY